MPTCVPIKDMKDTAAFAELVEASAGPVTVTRNGYDQFVVLRSGDYDELAEAGARARVLDRMLQAERERAEGRHVDAHEAVAALRARHGL